MLLLLLWLLLLLLLLLLRRRLLLLFLAWAAAAAAPPPASVIAAAPAGAAARRAPAPPASQRVLLLLLLHHECCCSSCFCGWHLLLLLLLLRRLQLGGSRPSLPGPVVPERSPRIHNDAKSTKCRETPAHVSTRRRLNRWGSGRTSLDSDFTAMGTGRSTPASTAFVFIGAASCGRAWPWRSEFGDAYQFEVPSGCFGVRPAPTHLSALGGSPCSRALVKPAVTEPVPGRVASEVCASV